jgi:hypothetical protein
MIGPILATASFIEEQFERPAVAHQALGEGAMAVDVTRGIIARSDASTSSASCGASILAAPRMVSSSISIWAGRASRRRKSTRRLYE